MAIQDLINEVNSIQTKKQAIKEAITAKGVTSEGKLSKFADEIKQITTKEPDWYIVNKFRYDNGNEALLVRTSDKNAINADKYQMVEIGGGVTKSNSINNSFNSNYDGGFSIINGTYFPRETAYRSFSTFETRSVVFDGHNDNLKLSLQNGKDIVFNDVNVYNWLKGYRNQPLADFNTLYLKSDGVKSRGPAKTLKDFLASSNETRMSTLGEYGQNPLLLIDSSIMIQVMNLKEMSNAGFISYSDKTVKTIFLRPVLYYEKYDVFNIPFYENKEKYYGNLSPGNYVHLFNGADFLIVFVSINFVVDSNGQKHKNIEVYIYSIVALGGTEFSKITDKPFELYITFSKQAQRQLQQASSAKVFRRQVLAANGTPEPKLIPMYLNGLDMLGRFIGVRGTYANNRYINNLFFKKNGNNEVSYSGSDYREVPLGSMYLAKQLGDAIKANSPIKAFIRLNDNTNNMTFVELEEIPNDGHFSFTLKYDYYGLSIFQKGVNNDNRVIAVFTDKSDRNKCKIYRLKKAGTSQYITNDMFSTTETDNQLFITANQPTIEYLNKTPLNKVWTEIQDVLAHKDDFEAYNEEE